MVLYCRFQALVAVSATMIGNVTAVHLEDRSHDSHKVTLYYRGSYTIIHCGAGNGELLSKITTYESM